MRTEVPFELLVPIEKQVRQKYTHLEGLATSINDHGLLQNLIVRSLGDGRYEVVAGERRRRAIGMLLLPPEEQVKQHGRFLGDWYAACTKSGSKGGVPVFVIPESMVEGAHIIENVQRENLFMWEEGRYYAAYNDAGQTYEWIALQINRSVPYVQERILFGRQLSRKVTDALEKIGDKHFLSTRALRKIARLYDPINFEPLHVRQVEMFEALLGKTKAPKQTDAESRSERIRVYDRARRLVKMKLPGHARPYVKALYEYLFSPGLMQKPDFDWK